MSVQHSFYSFNQFVIRLWDILVYNEDAGGNHG